jgi:hypothetical protein
MLLRKCRADFANDSYEENGPMVTKQTPPEDMNAQIERELQAQVERELQAEMAKKRFEIARRLRHEAEMKEYARINARHPIEGPLAGLTPEQHQARLDAMAAGVKADMESMNRSNSKPIEGSLLDQQRRADSKGGSAGFRIKPPGGA